MALDKNFVNKEVFKGKGVPNEQLGSWRSIEFEVVLHNEQVLADFVAFVESNNYGKFITIKDDGSIRPTRKINKLHNYENIGKEIIVSFCSGKGKIVYDVCRFLKDKAYVNSTTGAHIHFDCRNNTKEQVEKFGKRLACAVPALKQLLPKSRQNSHYCHDIINTIDGHGKDFDPYDDDDGFEVADDRYTFVNLQAFNKHKTIEIRGHSGTLNAGKILNWIKLCETIMNKGRPKNKGYIFSLDDLTSHYKIEGKLADFITKRKLELQPPAEVPMAPLPPAADVPMAPAIAS